MGAIFTMEMKKIIRDKGLYFWTFILPILFTVLFITVLTSGQSKEVTDNIIVSIIPGYTVMFVFFIMITMVNSLLKDQDGGMIARLTSTPLSSSAYLVGKWGPYILIVLIQMLTLFLFGKIIYNVPFQQPFFLGILAIILTLTVTGLGLALALLVKTDN